MAYESSQDLTSRDRGALRKFLRNGGGFALAVLAVILTLALSTILLKSGESQEVADPSGFSQTDLGNGWIKYESSQSPRFAISLPNGWQLSAANIEDVQATASKAIEDPELANMMKSETGRKLLKCCLRMVANNPRSDSAFPPSMMVMAVSKQADMTMDDLLKEYETNGRQSGLNTSVSRISSPAGEAGESKTDATVKLTSGQQLHISSTAFLFLKNQNEIIITLATLSDSAGRNAAIFDQIGQSFVWL